MTTGAGGEAIRAAHERGEALYDAHDVNMLTYVGDSTLETLERHPEVGESEVLFLEATHLPGTSPELSAKYGHTYLVRHGALELLTRDNSLRGEAERAGASAEEIEAFPDLFVRALGMAADEKSTPIDVGCREIQAGDALVLVTEHVHRSVDMAALGSGIAAAQNANAATAVVTSAIGQSPGHALGVTVMKRAMASGTSFHQE